MSKYLSKRLIFAIIYIVSAVIIEIITFSVMRLGGFPRYFFFDIFFIVFIAAVIFCVPYSGIGTGILSLALIAQGVLSVVNVSFYRLYGDIFTMDVLQYAGEVGNVISFSFFNKAAFFSIFPLLLVVISVSIILTVRLKAEIGGRRRAAIFMAAVMAFSCLFSFAGYAVQKSVLRVENSDNILKVDDKALFKTLKHKISYLKKFGTFALYWKNAVFKAPVGGAVSNNSEGLKKYFFETNTFKESEYFKKDGGNNVVVVMMESIDDFFIHPKYTPTLYNLRQDAINLTNYHSKAKTNISELSVILGNYPQNDAFNDWKSGGLLGIDKADYYPFSLTNILRDAGYEEINYFHPSQGNNYLRNQTYSSYFGFDNAYFMDDYPISNNFSEYENCLHNWSMPEKWFIDSAKDEMFPLDKQFFSFLTTINAHGDYTHLGSKHAAEFYNTIDDTDFLEINAKGYYDYFKNALAEAMCVDEGVEYILKILEERGLKDNTTILLYADHGTYFHELQYKLKKARTTDSFAYNVPAFIVSPNIKNLNITKFTNAFDLVPTLLQLLGIEYNTAFYYGNSAFDENESVISSLIGGIFNDKFYSYDGIDILYRSKNATDSDLKKYQTAYVALQEKMDKVSAIYSAEFAGFLQE